MLGSRDLASAMEYLRDILEMYVVMYTVSTRCWSS